MPAPRLLEEFEARQRIVCTAQLAAGALAADCEESAASGAGVHF